MFIHPQLSCCPPHPLGRCWGPQTFLSSFLGLVTHWDACLLEHQRLFSQYFSNCALHVHFIVRARLSALEMPVQSSVHVHALSGLSCLWEGP